MIRNLTAEAGGGQVDVTGSATLNGTLRFGLAGQGIPSAVLIQQGVGVVASANVSLSGTSDNSSLSGTVTVEQVSYAAKSDLGSLLSLAAPPVQAPSTPLPLLENMRLDVRVRSSNALGVQSIAGAERAADQPTCGSRGRWRIRASWGACSSPRASWSSSARLTR